MFGVHYTREIVVERFSCLGLGLCVDARDTDHLLVWGGRGQTDRVLVFLQPPS